MSDDAHLTCPSAATLEEELERLRTENARLLRATRDVARANAYGAELMARIEESHEALKREVQGRIAAEEQLRLINDEITTRVERQTAELCEANAELTKINQELRDFAYIVSHDLKAPLRAIKSLASWIASDCADKLDEEGRENLALLGSRVDRMHDLISGILQYSRIGRDQEQRAPVALKDLVSGVIGALSPSPNATVTVEGDWPTVTADATRMTQVFQNLIGNALKYMDKPQGLVRVTCTLEERAWKFGVADNGPGIEAQYFDRIFKLFQTLAPRDQCESTGVGLAVVKKIVEGYGGKVWVESTVGQGSTFFFTLPLDRQA